MYSPDQWRLHQWGFKEKTDGSKVWNSVQKKQKNKNYFTSSDPHHDMLGEGCQVGVVRVNWKCYFPNSWQRTMKKPLTLVFWTFACSCCVLPALQYSTWHKSCQRRRRNMPNHVRTPPGKHISINRHQTWQYTSWSKVNIRCSNHKCLQEPLEAFYAPNRPNHVRIPPVKQI